MPITDSERFERLGQDFTVILRIGARARDCTDVDDERYGDALQEFDEVVQWPRAMADCLEWGGHSGRAGDYEDSRRSARPLCRAT